MPKSIVSDFYHSGIVEVSVFTAEDIAEWIAYKMSVTNHQVGGMMRMSVYPCGDSTVSYVLTSSPQKTVIL